MKRTEQKTYAQNMLVLEFEEYELGVDNEKSHDFTCLVHSPTCQAQPSQLVLSSFSPLRLYSPSDSRPRAAFVNPTRLRLRHPSRRGVTRRGLSEAGQRQACQQIL